MEEIEEKLIEIAKEQLKQCNENKTVPSKDVLDTICTIIAIRNTY